MNLRSPGIVVVALALLVVASGAFVSPPSTGRGAGSPHVAGGSAPRLELASLSSPQYAPPIGPHAPINFPVGGGPDAILIDSSNLTVYVACQYGNNVSAVALGTNSVVATIPVGSQPYPGAIAYDKANSTVYVVNSGSNNVSAISVPTNSVSASIPVGAAPDAVAFNPFNHELYVANGGSADVTVINTLTNTVAVTIPVGAHPDAIVVDTTNHQVFVADAGSNNVTVLSGLTNTVLATIMVGSAPGPSGAMAFDPANGEVFVPNIGSDNVSVIGGTNHTVVASVAVGSGPDGIAIDPLRKEVFVANHYSNNVSVFSAINDTVVASIPVGSLPSTNGAIAFNPTLSDVYVPNGGSNNVSVISTTANAVVATMKVGGLPDAIAVDPTTGVVYVANQGSANVSAFTLSEVFFRAAGLPSHSTWTVSAGTPPTVRSNTTVGLTGKIGFQVPNGTLSYTVTSPAGYSVALVIGPHLPTQSSATVVGTTTLVVLFGHLETLWFNETVAAPVWPGLPTGTSWGVALTHYYTGGPPSQTGTTTGKSIQFTVPKGAVYKFQITKPSIYADSPGHGVVAIPLHASTKPIKFRPFTAGVLFREHGLPLGTRWQVNVTGPMNVSKNSTAASLLFLLVNGTYAFRAWNFSGLHPHPVTGSFVVVVPHATVLHTVNYTASPAPYGAAPAAAPGIFSPVMVAGTVGQGVVQRPRE